MRWPRCFKHCAPPRTLLSTSLSAALVVAFFVGLFVFALGTLIVRYADHIPSLLSRNRSKTQHESQTLDVRALQVLGLHEPEAIVAKASTLIAVPVALRTVEIPDVAALEDDHELVVRDAFIDEPEIQITWTREVLASSEPVELANRIDMLERLAVLGTAWARQVLTLAREQEHDPRPIAVIASALESTA